MSTILPSHQCEVIYIIHVSYIFLNYYLYFTCYHFMIGLVAKCRLASSFRPYTLLKESLWPSYKHLTSLDTKIVILSHAVLLLPAIETTPFTIMCCALKIIWYKEVRSVPRCIWHIMKGKVIFVTQSCHFDLTTNMGTKHWIKVNHKS